MLRFSMRVSTRWRSVVDSLYLKILIKLSICAETKSPMHVIGTIVVLCKLDIVLYLQPMHYSGGNALINLSHVLHCNLTLSVIGQSCDKRDLTEV